MQYLNIELTGLSGQIHPLLSGVTTSREVEKLRPAIKMLTCDYLTYDRMARDSDGKVSPHCRLCSPPPSQPSSQLPPSDTIEHIITQCCAGYEERARIFREILNKLSQDEREYFSSCDDSTRAQFILLTYLTQ